VPTRSVGTRHTRRVIARTHALRGCETPVGAARNAPACPRGAWARGIKPPLLAPKLCVGAKRRVARPGTLLRAHAERGHEARVSTPAYFYSHPRSAWVQNAGSRGQEHLLRAHAERGHETRFSTPAYFRAPGCAPRVQVSSENRPALPTPIQHPVTVEGIS